MRIVLFEDPAYRWLNPLVKLRPVFDLRCGILLLREKIEYRFKHVPISYFTREHLAAYTAELYPNVPVNQLISDDCLFINARLLPGEKLLEFIRTLKTDSLMYAGENVAAAFLKASSLHLLAQDDEGLLVFPEKGELPTVNLTEGSTMIQYSWDLVAANAKEIINDFALSPGMGFCDGLVHEGAHLVNPERIFIATGAVLYPGVVIIAEEGPVYIGRNVKIMPNAVIEGPAFIGDNSVIKIGAKIYEGTSIGEVCKVGGEVECSIIHSYSNKQHDGFLGHSYLAQWVNLGADTNNSDLKNNYGSIRSYADGIEIDTGLKFVGLTMGDHSKTGINTMINTGTVAGIMCNIFGADFPPKNIPDFSWGGAAGFETYQIGKALEVARTVKSRRKKEMGVEEERLIRHLYALEFKP